MEENVLTLAYLGDAVYEIYIREFLINKKIVKVNDLQKEAVKYVSARSQAEVLKKMIESSFLTEEEMSIMMRARNHKVGHKPKYASIITYKNATGLEAILGFHFLNKNSSRIDEIMDFVVRVEL